jgi:hypothetical protein
MRKYAALISLVGSYSVSSPHKLPLSHDVLVSTTLLLLFVAYFGNNHMVLFYESQGSDFC